MVLHAAPLPGACDFSSQTISFVPSTCQEISRGLKEMNVSWHDERNYFLSAREAPFRNVTLLSAGEGCIFIQSSTQSSPIEK